jgi:hypothetical protein
MVPANSDRISPVPPYSGYPNYINLSYTGLSPSYRSNFPVVSSSIYTHTGSYNPALIAYGLGSSAFARHYSRNHYCFLFLRVLRCFSSPGFLLLFTGFQTSTGGLPHSDICGSLCCLQLPAAFRSLPRPSSSPEPRHPPYALLSFLIIRMSE